MKTTADHIEIMLLYVVLLFVLCFMVGCASKPCECPKLTTCRPNDELCQVLMEIDPE